MNGLLLALALVGGLAILTGIGATILAIYNSWHENLVLDAVAAVREDLVKKGLLEKDYYGDLHKPVVGHNGPTWEALGYANRRLDALEAKNTKKKDKA